ncbi:zinc metalloprotease HtpX [Methanospirillum sp. J.3.6.1-F.2.7.3]|jgi:heat shock protein HtpX|uniref:Protease HtpX homolog n=2 Tax=Methanospirillum TaxID=2202 RepID=A0A8E7B4B5_9EURY|nr:MULTISPECIES: zinc metalloprotease HtpX [Methanospirillum]MDX8551576.1 zinc metalloprotease HtpX [Methanospirillum hungatei]NLW76469.1 zinc metalloprotease HtpX [Methanomicrobiales archaeon]QVV90227.1 zinc metalloprotease HtpX [Methanospirillum sp. J.3.6.1-F.2.7.3]QXO94612.1 zinc metalloprotease HtpX [Methanospirillum hungatei]
MKWKRDAGLTGRILLTWALLLLVYLVFMGILFALGLPSGFIIVIAVVMGVVQYFFSDKLVLMSTGAKIVEYDEAPDLHRMIEKLCTEADLPKPRIAVMHSPMPNAFATGRSPNHAVVAVTDSIMQTLNKDELEAVLAHELSHVKNRDILTMTVASFVAMIASMIMNNFLFASLFSNREQGGAWIIAGIVAAVVWVIATLLMMALSRYREFAADRGAAYITTNPDALISALQKISGRMDRLPTEAKVAAEGANAFYIIPALSGKTLAGLFSTHPSLEKRIENLEKVRAELRGY